ncbi:MAG: DEAD/DEAH box helicase, partial [Novosphingobium sp.]|nr:DEAD/DEAH box helicase [Novosphingobium sp.]
NARAYAGNSKLSVATVFGGTSINKNRQDLARGVDILVATPGRLLDLIDQRALTLSRTEIFVLDEADQMMDLGFIHALKRVANLLPKTRQSLFFSATMPKAIEDLGKQFIVNPVRVEVAPNSTTAERVEQYVTFINQAEKQALLTLRIRTLLASKDMDRALVFTRTKHGADRVVRHLITAGIEARAIHGNKSQAQRTAALEAFRQGSCPVLVATDIAARGIDVSGVSHVFNFELPNVPEQYVHRIGRTARAGADGIAMSFCAPDEKPYLKDIEKLTRLKIDTMALPENFLAEAAKLPAPSRKPAEEERDARHDARAQRGNGGRGGHGSSGGGQNRGEQKRGDQSRGNQNFGGKAQGRDGRPRDVSPRQERRDGAVIDRGPVRNPVLDATVNNGERDGNQPRNFRPRGNGGGAAGVGAHRNKVRRAS